jgi:serine/threonine protein kinase
MVLSLNACIILHFAGRRKFHWQYPTSDTIRPQIFNRTMIGTKLAHFEITSHLGSGGMGEVYEAHDAKLGRSVAIKFLPEGFSHDSERVA